jgi:hypothetical protein
MDEQTRRKAETAFEWTQPVLITQDESRLRAKRTDWHLLCHNAAVTRASGSFSATTSAEVSYVVTAFARCAENVEEFRVPEQLGHHRVSQA